MSRGGGGPKTPPRVRGVAPDGQLVVGVAAAQRRCPGSGREGESAKYQRLGAGSNGATRVRPASVSLNAIVRPASGPRPLSFSPVIVVADAHGAFQCGRVVVREAGTEYRRATRQQCVPEFGAGCLRKAHPLCRNSTIWKATLKLVCCRIQQGIAQ
eukprot:gene12629-biopygen15517